MVAAVLVRDFGIIGEWDTVRLLSDNIFKLLFLKSTVPAYHSVIL